MKLLVLTFYFPPDLSAGSYRAAALVEALDRAGVGVDIDVLTAYPHRYASYREVQPDAEARVGSSGNVHVRRIPVGLHRSGLVDQSLVFSGFAARALRAVRRKRYDMVIATSSRLFTGVLGAMIARRTGASLYLDVRDLFVDNVREMFRSKPGVPLLLPLLSFLERQTCRRAIRINLVSAAFLDYYRRRFPELEFSVFGNGIDPEFLDYDFRKPPGAGPLRILYAGNLGLAQGLEEVVPEAARLLGEAYELRIIGDGGQRPELERRLRAAALRNVALVPPMSRATLLEEYRRADYLLLHLGRFRALERVLPSKLFEYAATGKPILAGVSGYARRFITEEVERAAVFEPGDARALVEAVRALPPGETERVRFKERHARRRIMDRMAAEILAAAAKGQPLSAAAAAARSREESAQRDCGGRRA